MVELGCLETSLDPRRDKDRRDSNPKLIERIFLMMIVGRESFRRFYVIIKSAMLIVEENQ